MASLPLNLTVPESGQLVEVRRRQWIVEDVAGSAFQSVAAPNGQDLVGLVSVDEDSLGEELQVIWELEPGARVLDRAGLPTISGCDDPTRLQAFLDSVRWGATANADRSFLQSPFRSGVAGESYQLDPVVRAIDMVRVKSDRVWDPSQAPTPGPIPPGVSLPAMALLSLLACNHPID
jgi:hypothetical protein